MATVLEAFKSLREETQKVYGEVITKIGDLQQSIDNLTSQLASRELSPEEQAALDDVRSQLSLLDDIVPDPTSVPEAPGSVPGADNHTEPGQVTTAVPGDTPNPNVPPVNVDNPPVADQPAGAEEGAPQEPAVTTEAEPQAEPQAEPPVTAEPTPGAETPAEPSTGDNAVPGQG